MILLKREIIYNILLGEIDSSGDYEFESNEPRFSKDFIRALITLWRPDTAWEYVDIFCLEIDRNRIYLGLIVEGGYTKEIYMDFNLKILKER